MSQAWIFDFDGTLVDSEQAIKACYIKVTQVVAPERLSVAKNILIGPTLQDTTSKILGIKYMKFHKIFMEAFQVAYDNEVVLQTKYYPFADKVLKQLKIQGDYIAIATNKRSNPTNTLIKHYGWNDIFDWVACLDAFNGKYLNKTEMVEGMILTHRNFKKSYFVGDTANDGIAAKLNNLSFIKASYGYEDNENWDNINIYNEISSLEDLLNI